MIKYKIKIFFLLLILVNSLSFAGCSIAEQSSTQASKKGDKPLIHSSQTEQNQLPPCPDTPNCINTEFPDKLSQYLRPISFPAEKSQQIIPLVKETIINMGGEIIEQDNAFNNSYYLHATFTSAFFKFVDDFEIRIDNITHKLHIRSASRIGYSDFGANKRRVEKFSKQFSQSL